MAVRREQLALALGLLCFAGAFQGSLAIFKGATYVPDLFTNAYGQGGLFYCISAADPSRIALTAAGRQATIENCDATAGSPSLMKWVGSTIQPISAAFAGNCLDIQVVGGKPQAWFMPCSGATTQLWRSDAIGRIWSLDARYNMYVVDSGSLNAKTTFTAPGQKLVLKLGKNSAVAPTQSWFYIAGKVKSYTGKIVSHVQGPNGEFLCLDSNSGTQANTVSTSFTPCSPSSTTQTWTTSAATATVSCNIAKICFWKLLSNNGNQQFPSNDFRLSPSDASGTPLVVATKKQCLGFACNARNCFISIANGTAQAQSGNQDYQMLVRDCSPEYVAAKVATKIPAPGPRDLIAYQNHGNILAFFGTQITGPHTGNNPICMGVASNGQSVETNCSFRTIINNLFFTMPVSQP